MPSFSATRCTLRVDARRVHLGHRRHHGAVDALVALDDVLGEEAAAFSLGMRGDVAHARRQVAPAVAVAVAGAARAQPIGLGVHYRADHVLGQAPYEFPRLHRPVLEPSASPPARACFLLDSSIAALVLSFEPVMSAIPDSKARAASHQSHPSSLCLHQLSRRDQKNRHGFPCLQHITWRRRGDSNPRDPGCGPNGFRDRRIQPLCHPSEGATKKVV